jgi:hypothetical protein
MTPVRRGFSRRRDVTEIGTRGALRVAWSGAFIVVVSQLSTLIPVAPLALLAGCHEPVGGAGDASARAPVTVASQVPAPLADVRIGLPEAELKAMFPPLEDISSCAPKLVGGDAPIPAQVPGSEKKPRARCARAIDIGGMTDGELKDEDEWMKKVTDFAAKTGRDASDYRAGTRYTYAQVRGSIRAGTVSEEALLEADRGKSATAYAAVMNVMGALYNGSDSFAGSYDTRRTLCALIADSCDDLDPERVRTYVAGGYTLGQVDADAHSRVVYGRCRGPFLQGEKQLQMKLVRRTGALAAIGLAHAARADHLLSPDDPVTFSIYSSRSKLDQHVARFGVMIANALSDTERYWRGAVTLLPSDEVKSDWKSAVVWLRDGKIARVVVNVAADDKLGDLPKALADVYGMPGTIQTTVTTWSLREATTATLDIGAATSLVIDTSTAAPALATVLATSAAPSGTAATPGGGAAAAEMTTCCTALEDALGNANAAQRNGYATLLLGCRMNSPAPAAGRKSQLRNNANALNLPPLPLACQ